MSIIVLFVLLLLIPCDWCSNPRKIGNGSAKAAGRAVRRSCYYGKRRRR